MKGVSPLVSYLTTEQDFSQAIGGAATREALVAVLQGWSPHADDALAVAEGMSESNSSAIDSLRRADNFPQSPLHPSYAHPIIPSGNDGTKRD